MKYGVITACLNAEETIARTIHSVLQQTHLPLEYIFVDGGSTDDTIAIINGAIKLSQLQNQDIKFTLMRQTDKKGITQAWNMGLGAITSDLVFILNSDDWYEPDTAGFVLSCFARRPEVDIVLGSGHYFRNGIEKPVHLYHPRPDWVLPFAQTVLHPATFVRKAVYDRLGVYDESYRVAADCEFIYRCYQAGAKFRKYRKVLVNVQMGGFAEQNKAIAREELCTIGERYCRWPILPRMARLLRVWLNR